jgi:multicomponent Na+:H+ antiporter subunit B
MPVETWLIFLLGFMILGSLVALEIKDILSSIIAVGVVGLAASIAYLFLQAPDLAIVQVPFEIFALIILVRAFISKGFHALEPAKSGRWIIGFTLVGLASILALSIKVFRLLPPFGQPLMDVSRYYLDHAAADTGAANFVASVILDYRAYDTLGEVTVLLTAILGTLIVLRGRARNKKAAMDVPLTTPVAEGDSPKAGEPSGQVPGGAGGPRAISFAKAKSGLPRNREKIHKKGGDR